jgi:hypothetical protein
LFDALVATMQSSLKLQAKYMWRAVVTPPLQCGDFDNELEFFNARIITHVVSILKPPLDFVVHFNQDKVHNMMPIMLDPYLKGSNVWSNMLVERKQIRLLMSMISKF